MIDIRSRTTVAGLAAAFALASAASADIINFTYSDNTGFSATGSLQISSIGSGLYIANSGAMDVLASPAAELVGAYDLIPNPTGNQTFSLSPMGAFNYNDVFYIPQGSHGYLDAYGLVFGNGGSHEINIWGSGSDSYAISANSLTMGNLYENAGGGELDVEHIVVVPLPPAAFAGIAGLGLVGLTAARRRAAR